MKAINKVLFWMILLVLFGFTGCLKADKYPVEPVIAFKSFQITNDPKAVLSFTFTDGDGDIGFTENESGYNIFLTYYEMVNGVWQMGLDQNGNPVPWNYRTQLITPDGKNKAIRGTISLEMDYFYNIFSPNNDTVRFKIQIIDRASHLSNEVYTNTITH